ncbi:unnamed protein product [Camellia sinensis]
MNSSPDFSAGKSPKREIQGPRPAALKVNKDSHKIRKPPMAPPQQPPHQYRPPLIIYQVSPKVIHTNPSEFMTLVQRLTGLSSSSSSSSSSSFPINTGGVSPAARLASIEKTKWSEKKKPQSDDMSMSGVVEGVEISTELERSSLLPGILSPGPAALPPIPPNFFSPLSDSNHMSFFHDLSPQLQGYRNYVEGGFMPSPSNFLSSIMASPTPSPDLFNNFFDHF